MNEIGTIQAEAIKLRRNSVYSVVMETSDIRFLRRYSYIHSLD